MNRNFAEEITAPSGMEDGSKIGRKIENIGEKIERLTNELCRRWVLKLDEFQKENYTLDGAPGQVEYILQEEWQKLREEEQLPTQYDIGSGVGDEGKGNAVGFTVGAKTFPVYDYGNNYSDNSQLETPKQFSGRILKKYTKLFFEEILNPKPIRSEKDTEKS